MMPNFLIIGATKSGTTSLYHYLGQHPQVFLSAEKEPHFFAFEGETVNFQGPGDDRTINRMAVTDLEAYQRLFRDTAGAKAIGEASAMYICVAKAAERIQGHLPDARMIAILRNPAERAYSAYLHLVRDGREPLRDFGAALRAEEDRKRQNWSYLFYYRELGFYARQLARYFEYFSTEQLRIYLFEDLVRDPESLLASIFRFLGVDDSFSPDLRVRLNIAGVPRSQDLHTLLSQKHPIKTLFKPLLPEKLRRRLVLGLQARNLKEPPPMDRALYEELVDGYQADIEELQRMIDRDLSGWLTVSVG